jgi:hypothetical protein
VIELFRRVLRHAPLFSPYKSFAVNAHFIVVILSEPEPSLRGERESKDLAFHRKPRPRRIPPKRLQDS